MQPEAPFAVSSTQWLLRLERWYLLSDATVWERWTGRQRQRRDGPNSRAVVSSQALGHAALQDIVQ
jgi:hypothetical protein